MLQAFRNAKIRRKSQKIIKKMKDVEKNPTFSVEIDTLGTGLVLFIKSNFYIREQKLHEMAEIINTKQRKETIQTMATILAEEVFEGQCTVKLKGDYDLYEIVVVNMVIDL